MFQVRSERNLRPSISGKVWEGAKFYDLCWSRRLRFVSSDSERMMGRGNEMRVYGVFNGNEHHDLVLSVRSI